MTRFNIPDARRPMLPALLAAVLLLGGCAVGPDYQRPDLPLPAQYKGAAPADAARATPIAPRWWEGYGDAALTALIDRALAHNADVLQAAARIEQAEALDRQAGAAHWPQLATSAAGSRARSSGSTDPAGLARPANDFRLAASTSFELDFWGRLQRASEAARAQTLGTRYAAAVVQQTVASQVALGYFELITLDQQIALSRETLASRGEDLRLQQRRFAQGSAGQLDVEQAEAAHAEAALQQREYERQQALAQSRLALLTGTPELDLGQRAAALPTQVPQPPAGIPADLLARRPDVRQAEQALAAASARIGVSQAARLPSVSLTGFGGAESADLADLLRNPSRIWSLGIGLDLPVFDAGRRAAAVDQARAEHKEAQAAWVAAAHGAFRDVADALANLHAARGSLEDAARRERAATQALALARKRLAAGYSGTLEVLDAQRSANSARSAQLSTREAELAASVALYKALGGGWTSRD